MTYHGLEPDRGYIGDPRRGASLGRADVRGDPDTAARFHLRRVRLNAGGYDSGGVYWGHGGALFHYESADGTASGFVRIWRADVRAAFERRGGVAIDAPGYADFRRRFPSWSTTGEREAAKDSIREWYPLARFFDDNREQRPCMF